MTEFERVCAEKHKALDEKLFRHEKWLGEHETKIDRLTTSDATNTQAIKELCKKIDDLVGTIKWLIGVSITTLVGFFIYAVQTKIFR